MYNDEYYNIVHPVPVDHDEFTLRRNELIKECQRIRPDGRRPLGGSDLCKMLNFAYGSPYQILPDFRCRTSDVCEPSARPQTEPNQYMLDGQRYEFVGFILFAILHPDEPVSRDVSRLFHSDGYPFIVSADAILLKSRRILEIKCLSRHSEKTFNEVNQLQPYGLPFKYIPQIELYCRAYQFIEAVMLFLLPNEGNNRQWFEWILSYPATALRTITKEQARTMCFTRIYTTNDDLCWHWILRWVRNFYYIVEQQPGIVKYTKPPAGRRAPFGSRVEMEKGLLRELCQRPANTLSWMSNEYREGKRLRRERAEENKIKSEAVVGLVELFKE